MKLLTRTVRNYVIYSALLLLISTPLFYFSIQRLFVHHIDEELRSHRAEFYALLPQFKTVHDLRFFSQMNDEYVLIETTHPFAGDSIKTITLYDDEVGKNQPWRVLRTGVNVLGKPYVLQINESLVTTVDLVTAIAAIQVALISLLLAGMVLINRKLSRTIWDPFHVILDRLKKYQIDRDPSIELPHSSTSE
jgi:hypothetical protein